MDPTVQIAYTIVDAPLIGRLLVAGTRKGACSVSFGSPDTELVRALAAQCLGAQIFEDASCVSAWAKDLCSHLAGRLPQLDLPLDLRATAFQQQVWDELRRIPYGETRTYARIAEQIGRPSAVRAVARACATNPAALVIPCHRVLRSDGQLGGYRWGIENKRAILAKEKEIFRIQYTDSFFIKI